MDELLIPLPFSIRRNFEDINIQELVLVKVLEKVVDAETIQEFRELSNFNVEYHKANKKINGVTSKGCGCEYCKALNKYSILVLKLHRLERVLDDYWYGRFYEGAHYRAQLKELNEERIEARKEKNYLKQKLALLRLYNVA